MVVEDQDLQGIQRLRLIFQFVYTKECSKAEDCSLEGSVCSSGKCSCPPTYISNSLNTKCLPVMNGYGNSCEDNVQCSQSLKGGGICENNTCICSKGYHYFLGQCWQTAGLGKQCKRNENCFVDNDFEAAVCSQENICQCSPNYYQREYSSCRRESFNVGDECGISLDCKFDNAICTSNRTCDRGDNSIAYFAYSHMENDIGPASIELKSKDGKDCTATQDCPANSECNELKKCSCLRGFYIKDNNCNPEIGAKCTSNDDCVGKNTECRNSTVCVCRQGFVVSYNGQYCDKMSRDIGWSCLRDEQCGFFGPNAVCVKKKCQCNEKSHFLPDQMFCWTSKYINESCVQDQDCGGGTAKCVDKICTCPTGTHPSSDKSSCPKDSTNVGEQCTEDLDCIFDFSHCDNSTLKCACIDGYFNSDGKCLPGVGAHCKEPADCKADNSSCVEGGCVCNEGCIGSIDFSKCLPTVHDLTTSCSESSQCMKIEATCSKGYCKCNAGSHFIEGQQCFVSKNINEPCSSLGNCTIVKNSHCFKGICKCMDGYESQKNGTICSGAPEISIDRFILLMMSVLYYVMKQDNSSAK